MKKETKKELYSRGMLPHACSLPLVDETEDALLNTVEDKQSAPSWWKKIFGRAQGA